MISTLLSTIGIPVLTGILGEALGKKKNPAAQTASDALKHLEDVIRNGQISQDAVAEANRHAEKMAEIKFQEYEVSLSEINDSLRKEIESEDLYVRRMRPTFGYVMAATWGAQMMGIAYVLIFDTVRSGAVLNAMGSLSAIWAVGLSVLGVYVYKRSEDKKLF
jgi:hypothetical protein